MAISSVGTPTGRVILFGTIPTTIPDTTPVITPPATQTDTPVIPTETPIIAPTIPPSPDYTPASPRGVDDPSRVEFLVNRAWLAIFSVCSSSTRARK
ncbi:hypothetical protein Tco_0225179 [Tanacetum coccineum]